MIIIIIITIKRNSITSLVLVLSLCLSWKILNGIGKRRNRSSRICRLWCVLWFRHWSDMSRTLIGCHKGAYRLFVTLVNVTPKFSWSRTNFSLTHVIPLCKYPEQGFSFMSYSFPVIFEMSCVHEYKPPKPPLQMSSYQHLIFITYYLMICDTLQ